MTPAAAPATASSASADSVSPAGVLEPGRVQTAPGADKGDEAEDTLLAKAAASQARPPAKAHPWPPVESAVTNLRAETDEADQAINLSWDPPTYETDFQIRDYRYRMDYRPWVTVSRNARSQRSDFDTVWPPLNSGQRYRFQVRARFGTRITGWDRREKDDHLGNVPRRQDPRRAGPAKRPVL